MAVNFNLSFFFRVAAVVCFVVALLLDLSVFSGGNHAAWQDGGLLALTLSFLV